MIVSPGLLWGLNSYKEHFQPGTTLHPWPNNGLIKLNTILIYKGLKKLVAKASHMGKRV